MLKVVFDTVIFVRSLINPRSIWGSLVFRYADHYRLFLSPPLYEEILDVLHRPELTRKFRAVEHLNRRTLLTLLSNLETVEIPDPPSVSRDPKDNKLLATAQAAQAAYLVTEGQDLLVLREYEGTAIVTTVEFLRVLRDVRDAE